jgi:5'/3'-nucleotidase SurE
MTDNNISLLVTNDDGVSELLGATVRIMRRVAKTVTIVVPTGNRTGCSAAITLNQLIEIRSAGTVEGNEIWTVTGLPNDGVRYAMRELCPDADAIISGINDGWNLGYSVINSGTVGAAMEGIRFGKSGLALSAPFGFKVASAGNQWLERVERLVAQLLHLDALQAAGPVVLNVNLPQVFADGLSHARVLDVSKVEYEEWYEFKSTKRNGHKSVVLRGERMKPDDAVEDLQALHSGVPVINVINTPWTMNSTQVRRAIEVSTSTT